MIRWPVSQRGYPQTEIANASFKFQQTVETKDEICDAFREVFGTYTETSIL